MKTAFKPSSPSQLDSTKPASSAGFSILDIMGDKPGTKYVMYKPARIYDTGNKWYVYFFYRDSNGKFQRFKRSFLLNSIEDPKEKMKYAIDLRDGINDQLAKGANPFSDQPKKKVLSLVQALNEFKTRLYDRGLRLRTVQSYESALRSLYAGMKPVLHQDVKSITKQHISSYLKNAALLNKWSNATYNNQLTFIRAIFNYFIEHEIIDVSPASRVKPIPQVTKKNKYFDDATFEKIKKKAEPELLKFLMFMYHTGTRPNEARQLTYEDIDRERKLLRVPAGVSKNKKDDYAPLSDYILDNFKGSGLIFGTYINYFTRRFLKLKKELKLPKDMTMYSIKHTRAVHLAQDGASPYAIMQLFRHSGLDITMAYLRDLGLTVNREAADLARK